MQLVKSIGFALCYTTLLIAILLIKKNNKKDSIFLWIPLSIIIIKCWHSLIAGILFKIGLPISLVTIGLFDGLLGLFIIIFRYQSNTRQAYSFDMIDALSVLLFTTLAILIGKYKFGLQFEYINYRSIDAAYHFLFARDIQFSNNITTNLYLRALGDSLAMEFFSFLLPTVDQYRIFSLMSLQDYWLSGLTFYSLIRYYCSNSTYKLLGIIVAIMYWLGYPMYAFNFGFSYYSTSISLITCIIIFVLYYEDKDYNRLVSLLLLNFSLYGLFMTYTFLVPPIYLGLLSYFTYRSFKDNSNLERYIKEMLSIFLLPTLFGMIYAYVNLSNIGANAEISVDGFCYLDLFSNFIYLLPFILISIITRIKKTDVNLYVSIASVVYTIILFYYSLTGAVSIYYFSKVYNLLWLVAFVSAFKGLISIFNNLKISIISLVCSLLLVMFISHSHLEAYLFNLNNRYITGYVGEPIPNIYKQNYHDASTNPLPTSRIELFKKIDSYCSFDIQTCMAIGDQFFTQWFKPITMQNHVQSTKANNTLMDMIVKDSIEYVVLHRFSDLYNENIGYIQESGTLIFENNEGQIYKLDK